MLERARARGETTLAADALIDRLPAPLHVPALLVAQLLAEAGASPGVTNPSAPA